MDSSQGNEDSPRSSCSGASGVSPAAAAFAPEGTARLEPATTRTIRLNGQIHPTAASTVIELLRELKLDGRPVAVERNRQILDRSCYESTPLEADDSFEIIQFVGGG